MGWRGTQVRISFCVCRSPLAGVLLSRRAADSQHSQKQETFCKALGERRIPLPDLCWTRSVEELFREDSHPLFSWRRAETRCCAAVFSKNHSASPFSYLSPIPIATHPLFHFSTPSR